MHFSTLLSLALAAAPAVVSAQQGSLGWSLGVQNPDGSCKSQSDYESDFDALQSTSKIVRIYSAYDCQTAQNILPAAKSKGFQVILGIWPSNSSDTPLNNELGALKTYATQYTDQVYAVTVASEALYRQELTGDQIVSIINQVKPILPGVKLGTADSWNKWNDGSGDAVAKVADIILSNAFAYWQGTAVDKAPNTFFDDIGQALEHIQNVRGNGNFEFWVGETGWPGDGGTNYGAALAGTSNAASYWKNGICGMRTWGVNVFAFEAFDEPWKPDSIGDSGQPQDEKHWGAYDQNRKAKYDLSC